MSRVGLQIDEGVLSGDVTALLRDLRRIDPDLRREVPDRIKNTAAAQGLLADVRARQPAQPTRGWNVGPSRKTSPGRLNWSPGRIRQQITLNFRGSRPRGAPVTSWPVLRIQSKNAAQNVFELAGARQPGSTFNRNIMARHGQPKRLLYRALQPREPIIEAQVRATIDRLEREVTRRLAK